MTRVMPLANLPKALTLALALLLPSLAAAGDGAVAEPSHPVSLKGTLRLEPTPKNATPRYTLLVETGAGNPPAIVTYRVVTRDARLLPAFAALAERTVVLFGRAGERGDEFFLFVEAIHQP